MTSSETKSPAELRAERHDSLRSEWDRLSGRVSLGHLHDEMEDTGSAIGALPRRIADLRQRGYSFRSGWEAEAEALSENWPERRKEARRILRVRVNSMQDLQKQIRQLVDRSPPSDQSLNQLDDKLDSLESQISSAERDVRGAFDALETQLYVLQRELDHIEEMLEWLDGATFDLYPQESIVAACEAEWTNHPDEPEGLLFLTDGRVLFEQREKKAKKKMLFITTESEIVKETMWESAVGNLRELEAEDEKKFLKRKELLHLRFREYTSGLQGDVTLRLKDTTNEEWAGLIKRVQSGEIEADRVGAAEEAVGEPATPLKEIPTKCPACGGKLPPVVKGMQELVCDYCGTSVRL